MRKVAILGVWCLAACSGGQSATTQQTIQSSAEARAFNVGAYAVDDNGVTLLDNAGVQVGRLTVSTSADQRDVLVSFFDTGETYRNEVTRPVAERFVAPADADRNGSVTADPALARFFADYALEFRSLDGVHAEKSEALQPETWVSCTGYDPWPSGQGCVLDYCDGYTQNDLYYYFDFPIYECPNPSSFCASNGYYSGGIWSTDYSTNTTTIYCTLVSTTLIGYADCNTTHGCASGRDLVAKQRSCLEPGSCTNVALGYQGCY